jgi:hypothetical protein
MINTNIWVKVMRFFKIDVNNAKINDLFTS